MITDKLLKKYPIISDQVDQVELQTLLYELEKTLQKNEFGSVVEFGCYVGTTSLFIRRLLDCYKFDGSFHVYDSFAGLPEKTSKDCSVVGDSFVAGELAASRKVFMQNFKKAGLRPPLVHKGWFADFADSDIPKDIGFAFFDGDFYDSIADSFRACNYKFSQNPVIVVDDYANEALPGAARATDEWLHDNQDYKLTVVSSLAIIKK